MGKRHRLQKRVKSEKGKTQFKANSKFLPKGTNVTNAEFKIKQIIVPSQLTLTNDAKDGPRNLNLKELLRKLKHHNEKCKISACEDVSYFISNHKNSIPHLYLVIEGLSEYIQEPLPKARKAGLNTINTLLQSFTEGDINPHFHYFSVNLRCAMTHIDRKIREDSLLFLDAFLIKCPKLLSKYCDELLPNFLMLISDVRNQSNCERSLSINLKSSVTSTQWRISVLSRLYSIMEGAISHKNSNIKKDSLDFPTIQGTQTCQFALFKTWKSFFRPCDFVRQQKNETDVHKQLLSLFPLLLDIWLEGAASKSVSQDATFLSEESAMLLNCITKVIYAILQFLEQENKVIKSAAALIDCLVQNLPYRLREGNRMTKSKDRFLKHFHTIDVNCFQQNSLICYFYLLLHSDSQGPSKFIHYRNIVNVVRDFCNKDSISPNVDVTFFIKMLQLLLIDQPITSKVHHGINCDILKEAIGLHKKRLFHRELDYGLLNILANIRNTLLVENEEYIDWLEYLPRRFLMQSIHENDINILLKISSRDVKPFNQAYMKLLNQIYGHLDDLNVADTSTPHNAKLKILDILFYTSANDESTLISLRNILGEDSLFWPHVVKVFSMKRYINSHV